MKTLKIVCAVMVLMVFSVACASATAPDQPYSDNPPKQESADVPQFEVTKQVLDLESSGVNVWAKIKRVHWVAQGECDSHDITMMGYTSTGTGDRGEEIDIVCDLEGRQQEYVSVSLLVDLKILDLEGRHTYTMVRNSFPLDKDMNPAIGIWESLPIDSWCRVSYSYGSVLDYVDLVSCQMEKPEQ